jgi:large subunit ribosomal protein L25
MEEVIIKASHRDVIGKQVKALRREGKLPAVLYGRHIDPITVIMDLKETTTTLRGLSPSALITIDLDGEKHAALVREKQRNPLSGAYIHLDFQVVSMLETLRTNVSLEIIGEAPAVKLYNAVLYEGLNAIEVECLPKDLPQRIQADVSGLKAIGDALFVRDLSVPAGVEILTDPDTLIAIARGQAAEEAEISTGAFEPEVVEKGKKEEDEDNE